MTYSKSTSTRDRGSRAPDWVLAALQPFLITTSPPVRLADLIIEWRFESRYFSSLLYFTMVTGQASRARFVAKFPKATRGRGFRNLPPRTLDDRELAAREYEALISLSQNWPRGDTAFVQPSFYDPATGMLVFEHLEGRDLYARSIPRSLLLGVVPPGLPAVLRTIGQALGLYHAGTARPAKFNIARLLTRLRQTANELRVELPSWMARDEPGNEHQKDVVPAIKGFEVRNVRIAEPTVWFFDPGRLRQEPPEADVARFLVSLKMLGWGTPFFPLPINTSPLERAFLAGYISQRSINQQLVALHGLREILWNWREALEVVASRAWPFPLRSLARRLYIDLTFRRMWQSATRGQFLIFDQV